MWVVEVQHASDHDLDGKWYRIEQCATKEEAHKAKRWHTRDRLASYIGRPVRIREIEGTTIEAARPTPPSGWQQAVRRARRRLRS